MRSTTLPAALMALCGGLAPLMGCGAPAAPIAAPPAYEPAGQSKCAVAKDHEEPLIIEWPAAERASLEALSKRGTVVVRYQGCEMQVLTRCQVAKPYAYTPTTPQHERVTIRNEDELYARLPLGAARLAGELDKAGQLVVAMTIVGTYASDRRPVAESQLEGECAGATHVVNALTVGAFEFSTDAEARVGGGADVAGIGAGARSESTRTTLNRGGDRMACGRATGEDGAPPFGCGSLLRVEVARIVPGEAPAVLPVAEPAAPAEPVEPAVAPAEIPAATEVPPEVAELPAPAQPLEDQPEPRPDPASSTPEPELASASSAASEPAAPAAAAPSVTAPAPASSAPTPADQPVESGSVWPYLLGGSVAVVLVGAVIVGSVIEANKDEEEEYVPQAGGLGEETLFFRAPVIRW